jgi:hypothetical protein
MGGASEGSIGESSMQGQGIWIEGKGTRNVGRRSGNRYLEIAIASEE